MMKDKAASFGTLWAVLLLLVACGSVSAQQATTRTVLRAGKTVAAFSGSFEVKEIAHAMVGAELPAPTPRMSRPPLR